MTGGQPLTSFPRWPGAVIAALALLLAGCRSLPPADVDDDWNDFTDPSDQIIEVEESEGDFARALAYFGSAQLYELDREHDRAIEAYREALVYDPDYQDTYLQIALLLIRSDRTDEAIDILRKLSDRRPDEAQPLIWLGSAYRHERDADAAIRTYRRALDIAPDSAGIYIQLVDLLIQRGDEEEAIELLTEGTRKADDPVDLYRVLGEMYMRQSGLSADPDESRGYFDQAVDTFKAALEIDPEDATLLNTLGDLYLREQKLDQAIEVFERMEELIPDDLLLKERLAKTYELAGRLEDAARALEDLAEAHPTNARVFFSLGALYERMDETEKAITNYELAARLDPREPAAYLKLGVLQMEDAPDKAVEALREGLSAIPGDPRLLEMLGYVLFNKQEYAAAVESFREAESEWLLAGEEALTPNFYLYLALAYYFDNQPEAVPEVLGQAMERNRDALEAFAHFLFQDEDSDRVDQAVPILETMLEQRPDDAAIMTMLAYVHSFQEDFDKAIEAFDRTKELAVGAEDEEMILNPRFYFWYAAAHEREEMHDRAEELFYRCLELDPENAEAYNYLAYMWAEKGINLDKAKEYVLIALDARPDSGAFIDTLGWIYYQQGRYEEAYTEIKRALEIIPDDPTILDHLGDIYLKLDEPEKAQANWKRSFIIDPDNEEVGQKLAEYGVDLDPLREEAEAHAESEEESNDIDAPIIAPEQPSPEMPETDPPEDDPAPPGNGDQDEDQEEPDVAAKGH